MKGNAGTDRRDEGERRAPECTALPSPTLVPRGAAAAAAAIAEAWRRYAAAFAEVTRRAPARFEARDWRGAQQDAARRLALYGEEVAAAVAAVRERLAPHLADVDCWAAMRTCYTGHIAGRDDVELAETFFNSVTRRVLTTVGVESRVEFADSRVAAARRTGAPPIYTTHPLGGAGALDAALVARVLEGCGLAPARWADLPRDAARVAGAVRAAAATLWDAGAEGGRDGRGGAGGAGGEGGAGARSEIAALDVLPMLFFRNKGAYLVARLRRGHEVRPVVLALLHGPGGIYVDAALTTSDEASVVFGFSWSYFRVDAPRPRALIDFLRSIMPLKRLDELYTAIGHSKHGKTELYRTLVRHLQTPEARFEPAAGDEGLVMAVFGLRGLNVVFKIIKDRFGPSKRTTRRAVMDRYHFVFVRDRAGRLADAQEFEHLALPRRCFEPALLAHLLAVAGETVRLEGDRVVVRHLYTERRVTPLNLFLREAEAAGDRAAAREAVLDYGRAIKELAGTDIFTGDMLMKNFGVSRHGRVIFYDYDELTTLQECRFRRIPEARTLEDELASEPWFPVGEHDVFPEEFRAFLVPPPPIAGDFLAAHGDLLDVEFWQGMQRRLAAGELFDVFPYPPHRRFPQEGA
ncbi:MAG TPA: bifunctional isocitrate dehydrogenase kinase/phosphatase [Gemmatimonadales bacterium]|nr:bifunctional isocitrate dehydrogenase kinase/phosphatase [Gemmatimonadales bacterium]